MCDYENYKSSADIKSETEKVVIELPVCLGPLTLSATGRAREKWPDWLGDYTITGKEHGGRPVYRMGGSYLFTMESGAWRVDYTVGNSDEPMMRSINPATCPALCREWEYLVRGGKYEPGEIRVECSVHR